MPYLNVQLSGLSGRPHPTLLHTHTTQYVKKLRALLTGDFVTCQRLALDQSDLDPACKLCRAPVESTQHVLTAWSACLATADVDQRIFPKLLNLVAQVQPDCELLIECHLPQLTQF